MRRSITVRPSLLAFVLVLGAAVPVLAGPAPPITAVGVYAVCSAKEPNWVYPHTGQYATTGEGGAWVAVCTAEVGYGTPQAATINGVPGTELTQYRTPMVQNGVITGYYRVWYFQGGTLNGEFVYMARSINGGKTMPAGIYIDCVFASRQHPRGATPRGGGPSRLALLVASPPLALPQPPAFSYISAARLIA